MSPNSPSTSMNHEVEAKILEVSPHTIKSQLDKIGAKFVFDGILRAQWLRNVNDEQLRVRQEGGIVMVEHKQIAKGNNDGIKSANETGFRAENFKSVIDTLLMTGFTRVGLPSVKRRVSYLIGNKMDGVKLDFDSYMEMMGKYGDMVNPVIPTLLEIESKKSREEVVEIALALGFQESDLKDWLPVKLFQHYHPNEPIL